MGLRGLSLNPGYTVKHYVHTKEGISVGFARTRSWQMFSLITEAGRISRSGGKMTHWNVWINTLGREIHGSLQRKTLDFNSRLQLISGNLHIFQSLSCNDFNFVDFKADAVVISITNNNNNKKGFWYPYFIVECNTV